MNKPLRSYEQNAEIMSMIFRDQMNKTPGSENKPPKTQERNDENEKQARIQAYHKQAHVQAHVQTYKQTRIHIISLVPTGSH